jgi:hypothetical protein
MHDGILYLKIFGMLQTIWTKFEKGMKEIENRKRKAKEIKKQKRPRGNIAAQPQKEHMAQHRPDPNRYRSRSPPR